METNKEKLENGKAIANADSAFEASPKIGYAVSMTWMVN